MRTFKFDISISFILLNKLKKSNISKDFAKQDSLVFYFEIVTLCIPMFPPLKNIKDK